MGAIASTARRGSEQSDGSVIEVATPIFPDSMGSGVDFVDAQGEPGPSTTPRGLGISVSQTFGNIAGRPDSGSSDGDVAPIIGRHAATTQGVRNAEGQWMFASAHTLRLTHMHAFS
jgi:hypothetical protein